MNPVPVVFGGELSDRGSAKGRTSRSISHAKMSYVTSRVLILLFALISAPSLFAASKGADELAGAVLFRDKGCAHCHGEGGIGTRKAPSLVDIRKRKEWTPARITDQILNGGQKMPPFSDSLSDPEVAQIVAYLRAKHPPLPTPLPPGD